MPDGAIPIPAGLDLCGNLSDMTLFAQLINLNFQLIVKTLEEQQSITLELPGVPPILIPGFPGIQIPGLQPFDIGIQAERQSLETAWIGGRILRGVPYDKRRATGQYGGTDGVNVGGTDFSLPGTDPFLVTMQYVQQNFEILTQIVPTITTIPVLLPGAPGSLCSLPPGQRQPLINQIIDVLDTQFRNAVSGASGPATCPSITSDALMVTSGRWVHALTIGATDPPSSSSEIFSNSSYTQDVTITTVFNHFSFATGTQGYSRSLSQPNSCINFHYEYDLSAEIISILPDSTFVRDAILGAGAAHSELSLTAVGFVSGHFSHDVPLSNAASISFSLDTVVSLTLTQPATRTMAIRVIMSNPVLILS